MDSDLVREINTAFTRLKLYEKERQASGGETRACWNRIIGELGQEIRQRKALYCGGGLQRPLPSTSTTSSSASSAPRRGGRFGQVYQRRPKPNGNIQPNANNRPIANNTNTRPVASMSPTHSSEKTDSGGIQPYYRKNTRKERIRQGYYR